VNLEAVSTGGIKASISKYYRNFIPLTLKLRQKNDLVRKAGVRRVNENRLRV